MSKRENSKHANCRRGAKRAIERAAYALYTLKLYGLDGCPAVKITRNVAGLIKEAEETIGKIRRELELV